MSAHSPRTPRANAVAVEDLLTTLVPPRPAPEVVPIYDRLAVRANAVRAKAAAVQSQRKTVRQFTRDLVHGSVPFTVTLGTACATHGVQPGTSCHPSMPFANACGARVLDALGPPAERDVQGGQR